MKKFFFTLLSIAFGIGACLLVAAIMGENPFDVFYFLLRGAFGNLNHIGFTLFYTTPLIFTGLSVAVAFHGGLFNIGAEGQLYMGALALAAVGILMPHMPLAPLVGICVAMAGGALWGLLAGWFKAYRGAHEVIVTIMLNFLSYAVCSFFIMDIFKSHSTQNPETKEIASSYFIGGLGKVSESTPLNQGFILALLACVLVWFLLFKTKWGFELRLCGAQPETAKRAGISVKRRLMQAMVVSGALAGLVAVNELMGNSHKFRDGFSPAYGFMGIAVALLGRNSPLGIIFSALLFGALQKGALELEIDSDKITRDVAGVMQAAIILFVASESYWTKLYDKWRGK